MDASQKLSKSRLKVTMASATQDNTLLVADNYSEKSFGIYGKTKDFKDSLKALGGRFNKYLKIDGKTLPGWIFSKQNQEAVMEFVMKVNSGEVVHTESLPTESNFVTELPTVNTRDTKYQFVKFKIYKPSTGQKIQLKVDGKTMEGKVVKIETHNDIVDTAYVEFDGNTSLAVICRGKWTIFGYNVNHSIYFSD